MGMFEDEDIADATVTEDQLPPDKYSMIVSSAEVKRTKSDSMSGLNISYTVTHGLYEGRQHFEWLRFPIKGERAVMRNDKDGTRRPETDDERATHKGYIKKRLLSLGISEERIKTVEPDDLIGSEVIVELYKDKKDPLQRRIASIAPGKFTDNGLSEFSDKPMFS